MLDLNRYMTVVLEMPADKAERAVVLDALPLGGHFKGARITAMQIGDAISEIETLEQAHDASPPSKATLRA